MTNQQPPRGFALIELAMAIGIFSLLLGAGLSLLNGQVDHQRLNTTRQRMNAVKTALENHIARTGRLPCPAVANLVPDAAGYGVEAVRVTGVTPGCTGTTAAGDGFKGVVPWISLGLPGPEVNDGVSHRLTYQVSRLGVFEVDGSERQLVRAAGMRGNITLHNVTPIGIGIFDPTTNPNGNQINGCENSPADSNACNNFAVVVLVSHGKNGRGAWQEGGIQIQAPAAGFREETNTDNDGAFLDQQIIESDNAQHFDDLVLALAPRGLLAPMVATQQVKAERAVLDEGFQAMKDGVLVWAFNNKTGPVYQLPINTANVYSTLNPITPVDPWGSQYAYSNVLPSIGAGTNTGVAYTVTSPGPDGAVAPPAANDADNVVVSVSAAEVHGILAKTGF